jgi:hypothetical protein
MSDDVSTPDLEAGSHRSDVDVLNLDDWNKQRLKILPSLPALPTLPTISALPETLPTSVKQPQGQEQDQNEKNRIRQWKHPEKKHHSTKSQHQESAKKITNSTTTVTHYKLQAGEVAVLYRRYIDSETNQKMNAEASYYWWKWFIGLGLPGMLMFTATTTGMFSQLQPTAQCGSLTTFWIVFGVINSLGAGMMGAFLFVNPGGKYILHQGTAQGYASISRQISDALELPFLTKSFTQLQNQISTTLDELERKSALVPRHISQKYVDAEQESIMMDQRMKAIQNKAVKDYYERHIAFLTTTADALAAEEKENKSQDDEPTQSNTKNNKRRTSHPSPSSEADPQSEEANSSGDSEHQDGNNKTQQQPHHKKQRIRQKQKIPSTASVSLSARRLAEHIVLMHSPITEEGQSSIVLSTHVNSTLAGSVTV